MRLGELLAGWQNRAQLEVVERHAYSPVAEEIRCGHGLNRDHRRPVRKDGVQGEPAPTALFIRREPGANVLDPQGAADVTCPLVARPTSPERCILLTPSLALAYDC